MLLPLRVLGSHMLITDRMALVALVVVAEQVAADSTPGEVLLSLLAP